MAAIVFAPALIQAAVLANFGGSTSPARQGSVDMVALVTRFRACAPDDLPHATQQVQIVRRRRGATLIVLAYRSGHDVLIYRRLEVGWPMPCLVSDRFIRRTFVSPRDLAPAALTPSIMVPLCPRIDGLVVNSCLLWGITAGAFAPVLLLVHGVRAFASAVRSDIRSSRLALGRCPSCSYDLRGETASGCPECGWCRVTATRSA